MKYRRERKLVKAAVKKWMVPLGLMWWNVTIHLVSKKSFVKAMFGKGNAGHVTVGRVFVSWQYGLANVYFNLPGMKRLTRKEIEETVLHEFAHILVNEMREGEVHHEERVVTGLIKAFRWVRQAGKEDRDGR